MFLIRNVEKNDDCFVFKKSRVEWFLEKIKQKDEEVF